ncbi:ABC transporter permease [Acidobacteriota bacterium]
MFKNYLKIALRNITKHKAYSLINISGLAIGMACTVLILLWIQDELSTDRFHKHIDNLYKVVERQDYSGSEFYLTDNTPGPLAQALKEQFAEVADSTRFLYGGRRPVRYGDKNYDEPLCFTDPSFFDMFTFPLIKGDKKNVLKEPSSIVITEEMAAKYFGNEDPLGKILNLDNRYDFKVTGVLKDIPHNTHLYFFDFLLPFSQADEFVGGSFENWGRNWPWTYLLLQEGTSTKEYEKKIEGFLNEFQSATTLFMQPVKKINFYTYTGESSYIVYLYIFSVIAFFILLIACINFMNLSTARSNNRAKEVGMRKVAGANKSNIVKQFLENRS